MLKVKHQVKESDIHGLGLFALEFIPKGTIVWEFNDKIDAKITEDEFKKLSLEEQKNIIHYDYKDKRLNLYVVSGDSSVYINSSDSPNLSSHYENETDIGYSFANRDINIGEEITEDYKEYDISGKVFT